MIWATPLFLILAAASVAYISPWGQFPLNDDGYYTQNVLETLAAGKFVVSAGQYAYAIPQVLLGLLVVGPEEEPFVRLRGIGIVSGILAALLVVQLVAKATHQKRPLTAILGTLSTFFFLPYFQTSLSFMTDIPAFLLWVMSVWTLILFFEKRTLPRWSFAMLVNAVAVSERQLAILIPFSMVLAENTDFRPSQKLKGMTEVLKRSYPVILFVVPLLLIQWWWMQISPLKAPDSSFSPNPGIFVRASRQLIYLGWTAIPFLFIPLERGSPLASKKIFKRLLLGFALGLVLHVGNWFFVGSHLLPPFYGNVLDSVGILPILLSGSPEVIFSTAFRWLLLFLGFIGALRILWGLSLVVEDSKNNKWVQVILWSSASYFIFICFRGTQFDRYFIPVLPLSLLCLLKTCSPSRLSLGRATGTSLACFAYLAFSVTMVSDFFRWNEARREAVEFAFSKGLSPKDLCAGWEHKEWYKTKDQECVYTISFSELPDHMTERLFSYSSIWGSHQRHLYFLKKVKN